MTGKAACWREKNGGGAWVWVRFVFAVKQTSKCCPCCCPYTAHIPFLQKGAWQGTKKKTSGGKIVEKFYGQQQQKLQYSQGESGVCALDGCGKEDAAVTRIKHRRWDGKRSRDGELKKEKWMGNQFKEETAL